MEWLQTDCPADCLPKILAYCGPQQTAVLSRTNRHFHRVVCGTDKREATWRVLCEELYKVSTKNEVVVNMEAEMVNF